MSAPVEQQLRDLFGAIDVEQRPVSVDEVHARTLSNATSPERGRLRRPLLAAAAAVIVVAAALPLLTREQATDPSVDLPWVTLPALWSEEPVPELRPFTSGRWRVDTLGVPVTFDVDTSQLSGGSADAPDSEASDWWLRVNRPGMTSIAATLGDGDLRGFTLLRLGGWRTFEEASEPVLDRVGSIDPLDVDGWEAEGYIQLERREDAVVDGRDALVWNVALEPDSDLTTVCGGAPRPCAYVNTVSDVSLGRAGSDDDWSRVHAGVDQRIWLVPIENDDPILITAWSSATPVRTDASDEAADLWLDHFETTVLPTIRIGPDAPPMACAEETCSR